MMKKKLISLGIYFISAFFSVRGLIVQAGTVGHNWDWLIPERIDYLQNIFFNSFYTWQSSNLGESRIFQLPSLPFMNLLTLPSFFGFDGEFISKSLIIATIVLSGFGMFLLVENIIGQEWKQNKSWFPSFLAGFFYAFSPFLFADFIGGAVTQFFAYALFPYLLFFIRKINQEEKRAYAIHFLLSVVTLSLITISLQVLVLSSLILGFYLFIQKQKFIYLKNLILVYLAYLLLNLYWIIPTIGEYINMKQAVFSSGFFDPTNIKYRVPFLWEIFVATGYWRPLFLFAIRPSIVNFWLGISFLTVTFILAVSFLVQKKRESVFWLSILLISFIFATGGKEPMGDQVLMLYMKFPLMALFRSPQHLLVVPTIAFAVLLGLAASTIKTQKHLQAFLFIAVIIWLHPFFLDGDMGSNYLRQQKKDYFDLFKLSPGYQKTFNFLQKQSLKEEFRVLFLPMSSSPRYLATSYQNEAQGGDPLVIYSPYGSIVSDINYNQNNKNIANFLEYYLYERQKPDWIDQALASFNIKYLLVRKDIVPEFSDNKEIWDPEKMSIYLQQNPQIKKVASFNDIEIFENLSFRPQSHVLVSERYLFSSDNPAVIMDSVALNYFAVTEEILISDFGSKKNITLESPQNNIFLEPLSQESQTPGHIDDQNKFSFFLPSTGSYELLVKKADYADSFMTNPLNPLKLQLDRINIVKVPQKEENDWISYGTLNLQSGVHNLEINVPETKDHLVDGSFEEGTWSINPQAQLTTDSFDGKKALELKEENGPTNVFQEIKNIKPDALYEITFRAKTISGEPPHITVFQDTDIVRNSKIIPKVNHYAGESSEFIYFKTKLKTNIDTQKARLYFYADAEPGQKTTVLYDDVKIRRLFNSAVVLRKIDNQNNQKTKPPTIKASRLNPTRYLVEIQNATNPYFLTLLDSFNPQWKVFLFDDKESNISFWETWLANSWPESKHYMGNLYANSWLIDQKGNYKIIIEYRPQRLFYLGSLISALIFLILIANIARPLSFLKKSK